MKNIILIDIDTERDKPIVFGKPPDIQQPQNKEEAKAMVLNDIVCLTESLNTLILMASDNEYADKTELVLAAVKTIYDILPAKETKEQDEPKENN